MHSIAFIPLFSQQQIYYKFTTAIFGVFGGGVTGVPTVPFVTRWRGTRRGVTGVPVDTPLKGWVCHCHCHPSHTPDYSAMRRSIRQGVRARGKSRMQLAGRGVARSFASQRICGRSRRGVGAVPCRASHRLACVRARAHDPRRLWARSGMAGGVPTRGEKRAWTAGGGCGVAWRGWQGGERAFSVG